MHKIREKPILSMIHKYNIAELSLVDRPVKGPQNGFGTVVNKHPKGHDYLHRETSYGNGYGYQPNASAGEAYNSFKYTQTTQGGLSKPRPFEEQGVKCISGLTGEVYKKDDPQESTDVQRSWLPSKDPSVKFMQQGKVDQRQLVDNELSLPLGAGAHASFPLSDQNGFYRHKRTEITMLKNDLITRK